MSSLDAVPEPREPEKAFQREVEAGRPIIYRVRPPGAGAPSSPRAVLRADFVREVVEDRQWISSPVLDVSGAQIDEPLSLTSMSLPALVFRDCEFKALVLTDSRTVRVEMEECTIREKILAAAMVIDDDLSLKDVTVSSTIDLSRTRVGGRLVCRNVSIRRDGDSSGERRPALECSRMKVGDDVDLINDDDDGCHIGGAIDFADAEIGGSFTYIGQLGRKDRVALRCSGLSVKGSFRAGDPDDESRTAQIDGEVNLFKANIGGEVNFTRARISNAGGMALDAKHVIVGTDFYLDKGFSAVGQVRLLGASVGRQVNCTGGKFQAEREPAIVADGLIATDVFLNNTEKPDRGRVIGGAALNGAKVTRQLNCTSGRFYNPHGHALTANRLTCGAVYLNEHFVAEGTVSFDRATLGFVDCRGGLFRAGRKGGLLLPGAHISGDLDLKEASITPIRDGQQVTMLDGQGLTVDGTFRWQLTEPPLGKVDVSQAKVGRLNDDVRSWPSPGRGKQARQTCRDLVLNGFRYGSLEEANKGTPSRPALRGKLRASPKPKPPQEGLRASPKPKPPQEGLRALPEPKPLRGRLEWLSAAKPFSRQPYEELARVYREAGDEGSARAVAISEERGARRTGRLPKSSQLWSLFLDYAVGYGYKLHRVFIGLLIWAVLGFLLFHWAEHHNVMEAVGWKPPAGCVTPSDEPPWSRESPNPPCVMPSDTCTVYYPCFSPGIYATQLLIPVVNFRVLEYWLPDMTKPWGPSYLVYTWVTIVLGFLGVTALAGGISRVWRTRGDR